MSMADIEDAARHYGAAHQALAEEIAALDAELVGVRRSRMQRIKALVSRAAERKALLRAALEEGRQQFEPPRRTLVLHGIKVGFQKGKGSIAFDDPDAVLARIERLYQDDDDTLGTLITTTRVPNKTALSALPAADLKRLGCSIVGADDQVVICPADGDVEKIVEALLKDAGDGA